MAVKPKTEGYRIVGVRSIFPGELLTNPSQNDVLVDSGALEAGSYVVTVHGVASASWVYELQRRNTDNDANVTMNGQETRFKRRCAAGNEDFFFGAPLQVLAGERIRVQLVDAGVTGQVQASLTLDSTED